MAKEEKTILKNEIENETSENAVNGKRDKLKRILSGELNELIATAALCASNQNFYKHKTEN